MLTLARQIGVSERRLQLAFRDALGIGPNAFMRQRALAATRQALLRDDPAVVNVSSIAVDHGFTHTGRFSAYYRNVCGELPSETMRRSR